MASSETTGGPVWNDGLGTLTIAGQAYPLLSGPARNLRAVLNAFERNAWRSCIDNPIKREGYKDPREQLGEAVYRLNLRLKARSVPIRFRRNGLGQVVWEWAEEK